ncbi:Nephrin [Frankliniella fusca]|uniref:Nephrin n=1 Tax=Frankliniella fusca TaxID=407009 RepID=A0AAE1LPM6_9NEOP|nr:Nephrin [Frankliniella fusca]
MLQPVPAALPPGRPEPTVSWFANGRLLDGTVDASTPKVIVNRLDVSRVTRQHLNTTYRCQASNTRLIDPKHHDVRLDLRLRPVSVRLSPRPLQLPADEDVRFDCLTVGSRPQAVVTWWKTRRGGLEEHHFGAPHVETRENDTAAWSRLTFRPKAADDGATIRCHADNPHLDGSGIEDSFTLNVVHPPVVELRLGDTLNPGNIKEGDDVYFECSIRSNPPKHRIAWFHNQTGAERGGRARAPQRTGHPRYHFLMK